MLHTMTLIFSKEKPVENIVPVKVRSVLFDIIKNKELLKIVLLSALWKIATYCSTPFYGTYQIKELAFSMTFISVITIAHLLLRAIVSRPLGKCADKSFNLLLKI